MKTETPISNEHTGDCRCNSTNGTDVVPRAVAARLEADRAVLLSALKTANVFLELLNEQIEITADIRLNDTDEIIASVTLEQACEGSKAALAEAKEPFPKP